MSGGRPRTAASLKLLAGTNRPDREIGEATAASLELGSKAPTWLKGPRRKRAWKDLSELLAGEQLLSVLDAMSLGLLVDAYGDYLEASDLVQGLACAHCGEHLSSKRACTAVMSVEADVDEDGEEYGRLLRLPHEGGHRYYTTRTKEGSLMIRPHPAMAVRQDAWKRVVTLLREFGMTPRARASVGAPDGGESSDPAEEFLGARRGA